MFGNFLKTLLAPNPAPLAQDQAQIAMAALLVRVAKSDGDYDSQEQAQIDQILAQRYSLDPTATAALRQDGETLEQEAPDTVRFTRALKEAVAYNDRQAIVQSMWSVALADDQRDATEDALIRMVSSLLGVSDVDSAKARQAAQST
jgi:uncharacterized tellurite resistance protein B-like protein